MAAAGAAAGSGVAAGMLLVTGFDGMGPAAGAGLLVLAGAGAVRSPSAASRFAPRLTQLVRSNLLF